jgi:hypothetical protein
MSLNSNALCTIAQCKIYLDIASADTSQDSKIEHLINVSSSMVESYLDRKLIYNQYIELHDGRVNDRLILKEWPAEKPTEILSDTLWSFDNTTIIPPENYVIDQETTVVLKGYYFPRGNRNIRITYYAGYASPVFGGGGFPLPGELNQACVMLVAWQYQLRADRRLGIASKGKQGESISYVKGLPAEIALMLDMHVRMELPFTSTGIGNG